MSLTLLAPQPVAKPTGGNVYDRRLVEALNRLGVPTRLVEVPGPWPDRSPAATTRLTHATPDEGAVLVDGLVASGTPGAVAAMGARAGVIAHLPVPLETGMPPADRQALSQTEAAAMRAARLVVCPSAWTARYLAHTYGLAPDRLVVAHPGTEPAPEPEPVDLPPSAGPPALTCLATLTPRKNALALLDALRACSDLEWRLTIAGPDDADPDYAARVRADAAMTGGRVTVSGSLSEHALHELWQRTDLLVLPSLADTFGMVVTEAVARGIPAVVVAGTGAQEALELAGEPTPGAAVDLTDLPGVLRDWLTDPTLRERWRQAARAGAPRLPTWDDTARAVTAAFELPIGAS